MTVILTASFILLATIACLVLINSSNVFMKAGLIIVTIWYALALYFVPSHFAGFSKCVDQLPDKAWIMSYKIVEPMGSNKGGMYFWVIENYENDLKENRLHPAYAFKLVSSREPRSYKLPYSRKMHKQLEAAVASAKKKGMDPAKGGVMRFRSVAGKNDDNSPKGKFEIINPIELLPPKE